MTKRHTALLSVSIILLSALLLIGALSVFKRPFTPPQPLSVQALKQSAPVFDDEFNGTTLDTGKWSTCYDYGCSNFYNDELEYYAKDAVTVSGGSLQLTAKPSPVRGVDQNGNAKSYPYQSGMIATGSGNDTGKPKWTGSYGYYEARIWTPSGQGLWPAFWMLPSGETWPPEIDIMEQTGDKPASDMVTYYWPDKATVSKNDTSTYVADGPLADAWHTYGVLWQKGRLTWYLDGKVIYTTASSTVPSTSLELVFNLAVGGTFPGSPDSTTKFPASMKVDYVRVYAAK